MMPAQTRQTRQITAPAYMQKVFNVVIRVVAPEKSIDPCACAAIALDVDDDTKNFAIPPQ